MKLIENIKSYLSGTFRYKLYYSKYKFMLSQLTILQFEFRVKVMNKECYNQGTCVKCGCVTTALQMAKKSCDGLCYPPFMSKKEWVDFNSGVSITKDGDIWKIESNVLYKNNKKINDIK